MTGNCSTCARRKCPNERDVSSRRFYRQMFGLVLLIPVVMYTVLLYPVIAGGVF